MDNRNEFRPVEPKSKKFNVTQTTTRFPNRAMVTLSEVKEGTSKMITLSPKAIEALGITAESNRFAITRGFDSDDNEAMFMYATTDENYQYVSDKENFIKMDSAKLKWSTRRAMSAKFHGAINNYHSDSTATGEKYFSLSTRYGDTHWLLEEWQPTETDQVVSPRGDERATTDTDTMETTTNVGESAEASID